MALFLEFKERLHHPHRPNQKKKKILKKRRLLPLNLVTSKLKNPGDNKKKQTQKKKSRS